MAKFWYFQKARKWRNILIFGGSKMQILPLKDRVWIAEWILSCFLIILHDKQTKQGGPSWAFRTFFFQNDEAVGRQFIA